MSSPENNNSDAPRLHDPTAQHNQQPQPIVAQNIPPPPSPVAAAPRENADGADEEDGLDSSNMDALLNGRRSSGKKHKKHRSNSSSCSSGTGTNNNNDIAVGKNADAGTQVSTATTTATATVTSTAAATNTVTSNTTSATTGSANSGGGGGRSNIYATTSTTVTSGATTNDNNADNEPDLDDPFAPTGTGLAGNSVDPGDDGINIGAGKVMMGSVSNEDVDLQKQHDDEDEEEDEDYDDEDIEAWRAEKLDQIPALLRPVYRIISSTLTPHDSFDVAVRKMLIGGAVLFSPFIVGFGIYWLYLAGAHATGSELASLIAAGTTCLVFATIIYVIYLLELRATNDVTPCPFWHSDLVLTVGICYNGVLALSIPHYPASTNTLAIVQFSVVLRSDWFVVHAVLASVFFLIATYNVTFLNFPGWPLLAISEYHGSPVENLILTISGWAVIVVTSFSLYLHYSEFLRLVNRSSSTTQVGSKIAGHLRQWDLKGVEQALNTYHEQPNSDNFLHSQFANIVQTIRDFSVYLPRDIIAALITAGESLRDTQLRARTVTLAWIEIANFPALCDSVSCDELAKLLRRYHEAMARVLRQHEGVIVRLSGAMVCGMWNAPLKNEHAAAHALMAALHAVAVADDELNPKFEEEGFGLSLRVGVHTGTAMVGPLGSCERAAYTANGGAVHFAAAMAKFGKRMRRSSIMVSDPVLQEANADIAALARAGSSSNSGSPGGATAGTASAAGLKIPRFVTREAADARAARHTTTTLIHQLVGIIQGVWTTSNSTGGGAGGSNFASQNSAASVGSNSGGGGVYSSVNAAASSSTGEQQQQQQATSAGAAGATAAAAGVKLKNPGPMMPLALGPGVVPPIVEQGYSIDSAGVEILQHLDAARRMFDRRDFAAAANVYMELLRRWVRLQNNNNHATMTAANQNDAPNMAAVAPPAAVGSGSSGNLSAATTTPGGAQSGSLDNSRSGSQQAATWPVALTRAAIDGGFLETLYRSSEKMATSRVEGFDPVVVMYDS